MSQSVWRDKRRYSALRFRATIANALDPWGDAALGLGVVGGTRELGVRPHVVAADVPWLATLLLTGWPREDYEAFAHSLLDPDGAD